MNVNKDMILVITNGVRAREEKFGLLVVSKTAPALSLNMDSKYVWEQIDGNRSVLEILHNVENQFEGKDLEKTTLELLDTFLNIGLVEKVEGKVYGE